MGYFWKQQDGIPEGMSYPLFGVAHLSSVAITILFVVVLIIFVSRMEEKRQRRFLKIMPGFMFADWTVYYPVLNFMNIYSYVWHGMLILYPMLLKVRGDIDPSIKNIRYVLIFLLLVVLPVYIFDKCFGCNYFFVNWPIPDSPLSWMASFLGNPGYLIGYAALTLSVILLMYLVIVLVKKFLANR